MNMVNVGKIQLTHSDDESNWSIIWPIVYTKKVLAKKKNTILS